MIPASTVDRATLSMLTRLQLSLAAFVLDTTIARAIRLMIFAAQLSIPGPQMAVGTCRNASRKCLRRSR